MKLLLLTTSSHTTEEFLRCLEGYVPGNYYVWSSAIALRDLGVSAPPTPVDVVYRQNAQVVYVHSFTRALIAELGQPDPPRVPVTDQTLCAACRNVLGANLKWTLPCGHTIHKACCTSWLVKCTECNAQVTNVFSVD